MNETPLKPIAGHHITGEWPDNLCTVREMATHCGLSEIRLRELADARVIPHWRIDGGDPLFRKTEVRKWIALNQLLQRVDGKPLPLSFIVATEIPALATEIPAPLRPLAGDISRLPVPGSRPGIYFLCHDSEIVYVGQSVCPAARVASHGIHGAKVFDRAFVLPCLPKHLNMLEGYFISALKPRYNGNHGPVFTQAEVDAFYPTVAAALGAPAPVGTEKSTEVAEESCQA